MKVVYLFFTLFTKNVLEVQSLLTGGDGALFCKTIQFSIWNTGFDKQKTKVKEVFQEMYKTV